MRNFLILYLLVTEGMVVTLGFVPKPPVPPCVCYRPAGVTK